MEDADDLVNMISLNGKVEGGEKSCKNSIINNIIVREEVRTGNPVLHPFLHATFITSLRRFYTERYNSFTRNNSLSNIFINSGSLVTNTMYRFLLNSSSTYHCSWR